MRRNDKGFTLIEVLVALSILAGGIVMLTLSWSGNFMRIRKTTMLSDVSTLLERKMVETEAKYKTKQLAEIPDEEEGDFGSEHPQYKWKMKSKDLKLPDLSPLLIGQEDGADETLLSMIKQVSESLSKAIKEVRITIYVKRGPRTVEFAATEYFIDWGQDFASSLGIPGGGGAAAPAAGSTTSPTTTTPGH